MALGICAVDVGGRVQAIWQVPSRALVVALCTSSLGGDRGDLKVLTSSLDEDVSDERQGQISFPQL